MLRLCVALIALCSIYLASLTLDVRSFKLSSHYQGRAISANSLFMARKIDAEAEAMSSPKGRKKGGNKKGRSGAVVAAEETKPTEEESVVAEPTPTPTPKPMGTNTGPGDRTEKEEFINAGYSDTAARSGLVENPPMTESASTRNVRKGLFEDSVSPFDSDLSNRKVPRADPLNQNVVPPEIVFFGEPRNPPPGEAARDSKYHGSLLYWARHSTVAPRTSEERMDVVFPRGRLHPQATQHRLDENNLTYENILQRFTAIMDDLGDTKAFVASNIDLIASKLFLRVLTAEKLSAQSKDDLEQMDYYKEVRRRYILAHDQIFFPLNIEIQKAETRVMTYLARDEIRSFAQKWDEVEMSLHFTTLLASRLTWDARVRTILDEIKQKVKETVGYMAEGLNKDLMSREFRKPAITSEVYLNASRAIETSMPELYAKVRPEVQLLHETYFMEDTDTLRAFVNSEFLPRRAGLSLDQLKERLRIYAASLAAVQGVDYIGLRVRVQDVHRKLCSEQELAIVDKWFFDYKERGYGFETYEPDTIPNIIRYEQRIRDTGNAFDNFAVDVLKRPTKYSEALSGARKKAAEVGDWLKRDPDYGTPVVSGYEERMVVFREAYIAQTEQRKRAETTLSQMIRDRMAFQDKILYGNTFTDREMFPGFDDSLDSPDFEAGDQFEGDEYEGGDKSRVLKFDGDSD